MVGESVGKVRDRSGPDFLSPRECGRDMEVEKERLDCLRKPEDPVRGYDPNKQEASYPDYRLNCLQSKPVPSSRISPAGPPVLGLMALD